MTETVGGAEYRFREEGGGAVVTRCVAHVPHVGVPAQLGGLPVVALGDECFASAERGAFALKAVNGELERVDLPEGLARIGRAAFRGCSRLSGVALPDSLVEIDDLAFSCTSIAAIRLPRACTRLSGLALRTGPESLLGPASPYLSKIDKIDVDPANGAYCTSGGVLCRRLEAGALEAVLCPGRADALRLGHAVVRIAPTAFAGTYEIGTLGFGESVAFAEGCGLALQASCRTVDIRLARPFAGADALSLAMPSGQLQRRVFESTAEVAAFDLAAFLRAYDAAVAQEPDRLLQAKLMAARLARPLHLEAGARASFEGALAANFDAVCVQFGARNYWQGFEDMADAGLLDGEGIPRAVAVLTARADTTAVARVLQLKRERFREGGWDYGL